MYTHYVYLYQNLHSCLQYPCSVLLALFGSVVMSPMRENEWKRNIWVTRGKESTWSQIGSWKGKRQLREAEEMGVHSRGERMRTLEEIAASDDKGISVAGLFFPFSPPSGRLDDNLILAKFLCVAQLSFSIPFSLISSISIPLHTTSLSPQEPLSTLPTTPSFSSHHPCSGGTGTLVHCILSLLESW